MIESEYLYGKLDRKTAQLQLDLFELKKEKATTLLRELFKDYDLLSRSTKQVNLEVRVDKINKAIVFCNEQIEEAKYTLLEPEEEDDEKDS